MKKFKYRLQRVLDFRERIKTERLSELSKRTAEQKAIEMELEDLKTRTLSSMIEDGGMYSPAELALFAGYKVRLSTEIVETNNLLEKATTRVVEAREQYVEASKDAKALVKLREKKVEEYNEVAQKHELQFLDEITTQRIARRKMYER